MNQADKTQSMKYAEVARLASDTVREVMRQGEADGKSGWEDEADSFHVMRGTKHVINTQSAITTPDEVIEDFRHAITRITIAYYQWLQQQDGDSSE